MNTTLSAQTLSLIDQYLHFRLGAAVCSVPYFNNKTVRARAALPACIGKGDPREILDETETLAIRHHVATDVLADESLKTFLVDNGIGIDCSGFAYHILDAESRELKKGPVSKHLSFIHCHGLIGKAWCALRPARSTDVATLSDDANSRTVSPDEVQPGDFISMIGGPDSAERDHILVVHEAERRTDEHGGPAFPITIRYSHAAAYPEDGLYGSGIKQGTIEIASSSQALTDGRWMERGKEGGKNRILTRARKSKTELRRLKWW